MKIILSLLFVITTTTCFGQEKNLPTDFDFGKTDLGSYKNIFFELEIDFNPNWFVQDKQQMNNLGEIGNELITGDDQNLKAVVKASMVNVAYLLAVFKYEIGATVPFNPSFIVVAENTRNFPGVKKGSDYLFHARKFLEQASVAYYFEKDVVEKKMGTSTFHVLEAKFDYLNITITQEYVSTVTKGFSLSFILSYTNEDQRKELYEIVNRIKI